MSIMEKVFHYEATELSVIKFKDEIWFKAKQVALLLSYLDPGKLIRQNVNPEDRISLEKLIGKGGRIIPPLVSNFQGSVLYLNESGLHSLIFGSKLESAKAFKRWVTKENETDFHVNSHSFFTVTLGENQDTIHKRIDSFKKGYLHGSPDLIIDNLHKRYSGFAIEMKSPKGNGVLSPDQSMML